MIGTKLAHYEIRERLGRGAMGWGNRAWLEQDPDMDPIRDHPRFRSLLDRMGAPPGS